jgi:hypothetical protein
VSQHNSCKCECYKCDCGHTSSTGRTIWITPTPKKEAPVQPEPSLWWPTIVSLVVLAFAVTVAWLSWKLGRLERKP